MKKLIRFFIYFLSIPWTIFMFPFYVIVYIGIVLASYANPNYTKTFKECCKEHLDEFNEAFNPFMWYR